MSENIDDDDDGDGGGRRVRKFPRASSLSGHHRAPISRRSGGEREAQWEEGEINLGELMWRRRRRVLCAITCAGEAREREEDGAARERVA